jgi:hypothetical protein
MWLMARRADCRHGGQEHGAVASARPARAVTIAGLLLGLCLAANACASPNHMPGAQDNARPSLRALAAEYMAIARPANHRLDVAVEAYADHAHHDLGVAEMALRAEAATERWFDDQLARIKFPPAIAATARALIRVNEVRAAMTDRQARSTSIPALLSLTGEHKAADAQVEAQVRVIRAELGLPPPSSS